MYFSERVILLITWCISIGSLFFIPKAKHAHAFLIFSIAQFFSWIFGLIVVELNMLDYPVREFERANATSFSFEYFILPVLSIFFVLKYPFNKSLKIKVIYFVAASLAFTILEYFVEKYTLLIKYHSWTWYYTLVSLMVVFYLVLVIYKWFFKIKGTFTL